MGGGCLKRKIEANKYTWFHNRTIPFYEFATVVLISIAMNLLTDIALPGGSKLHPWQVVAVIATILLWSCAGFQLGKLAWGLSEFWAVLDPEIKKERKGWEESGRSFTAQDRRRFIEHALDAVNKETGQRVWQTLEPSLRKALIFAALGFLVLCLIRLDEVITLVSAFVKQFPSLVSPTPTPTPTATPTPTPMPTSTPTPTPTPTSTPTPTPTPTPMPTATPPSLHS